MKFLLYGATGYTGQIILDYAKDYGLTPVIAGRSEDKLQALAKQYSVDYLVFDLKSHDIIVNQLQGFKVILNCAGPFSHTVEPVVNACLEAGVHYLDITGEIAVFEWIKAQNQKAINANICLVSGVGFDVVPTDCIAGLLHHKMSDATHLTLAFASIGGGLSHGTATTLVENLGSSGAIRENGVIKAVPLGHKGRTFDFGKKSLFTMTIPWGDVSTAYSTTGIPNIEVYTRVPKSSYRLMKFQILFNWILRKSFIKKFVQNKIDKKITGPNAEQRANGKSLVIGIVKNNKGEALKALLIGPEGYDYTARASLLATKKLITEQFKPGYHTPSSLFGIDFATEIPETTMEIIE